MSSKKEQGQGGSTTQRPDEQEVQSDPGTTKEREVSFARRALIQAGWAVPVVMAVQLPAHAQASPGHADTATHNDHTDAAVHSDHSDTLSHIDHTDAAITGHLDHTDGAILPHLDHTDAGLIHLDHTDLVHNDHSDSGLVNPHFDHTDQG